MPSSSPQPPGPVVIRGVGPYSMCAETIANLTPEQIEQAHYLGKNIPAEAPERREQIYEESLRTEVPATPVISIQINQLLTLVGKQISEIVRTLQEIAKRVKNPMPARAPGKITSITLYALAVPGWPLPNMQPTDREVEEITLLAAKKVLGDELFEDYLPLYREENLAIAAAIGAGSADTSKTVRAALPDIQI